MTEFELYFTQIYDGKITACYKMQKQSERLLNDFYQPGEFHYDHSIASRHTDFIEKFCKLPSGRANTPLQLELFQKARLQAIFGFVDDLDKRRYREVLIIEGRKNGKTTETAAVELDLLVNDGEFSPQIYNLATMHDQAMLGFNACLKMVRQSPLLSKHIRKRAVDLYFAKNMGFIRAMSSNTNSLDGLDVHGATIDELAAIKNRDIYDLIKQASGARSQPLLFTISTNGFVRDGIFDAQYDYATAIIEGNAENRRFLPFIYELDSFDEWDKEDCWIKANPGLGTIKSLDSLREMVQKAKDDVAFKPTVLTKDFNLKQTGSTSWLRWEDFDSNEKVPDYPFKYFIGGFDAADTTDLTAAKVLLMKPDDPHIYVKSMYWLPEKAIAEYEEQGKLQGRDNVPYRLWQAQGYLRTVNDHKVDKHVILDWFLEIYHQEGIYPKYVGYDDWHIDESTENDFKLGLGKNTMIKVVQGAKTLSDPMKELKADLKAGLIVYDGNPIDKWCFANTAIKTDINANIQPVKTDDNRKRIDGTMALLDAYVVLRDHKEEFLAFV